MIDEELLVKELNFRVRTPRSTMEIIRDIIPLVEMQPKVSEQEIRNKEIEKFAEEVMKQFTEFDLKHGYPIVADCKMILCEIAEQMKEANNG